MGVSCVQRPVSRLQFASRANVSVVPASFKIYRLIQGDSAPNVGWDIQVLSLKNCGFALFKTALGNNLERELPLAHSR